MIPLALSASGFAAAAWLGVFVAGAFSAGRVAYINGPANGPAPVDLPGWAIPAFGALVGAGLASRGEAALDLATMAFVLAALVACAVCDWRLGVVPDLFTLVPLATLLLISSVHGNVVPLLSACFAAFPFAAAALLSKGRGMGWGDVKMVALGGALLGVRDVILGLTVASAVAFAASRNRGAPQRQIAFAPCLACGFAAALAFGRAF
jgi:prepilin signal peptidase PulO-like enzyme (type II secretory pathway)